MRSGSTAGWLAVARKIVDTWFGGDPTAFLANARAHSSWQAFYRKCQYCCPLRNLRVAMQVLRDLEAFGANTAYWLSMTQHQRLLPIEALALRAELAQRAFAANWSARQLADAITQTRATAALPCRNPGRPHASRIGTAAHNNTAIPTHCTETAEKPAYASPVKCYR